MKTNKITVYVLGLLLSAATLAGCNNDKYQKNEMQEQRSEPALGSQQDARQTNPTTPGKQTGEGSKHLEPDVGGNQMLPSQTIPENAQVNPDLDTFISVVKQAGLLNTLNGTGPYTVFAPSNEAFKALPSGTLEDLMKPENKQQFTAFLNNHIVAGKLDAASLQDGSKIKTLGNLQLDVARQQDKVTINGAKVTTPDVVSSNGVMHIIDKVLAPAQQ
ncbi:MAG TPA: fasciclin domain-containing protein [Pontibacter sp.]